MNVLLNGELTDLPEGTTVARALAGLDLPDRGVAVAVDREVIPRGEWDRMTLGDGMRVEVVRAVQGG